MKKIGKPGLWRGVLAGSAVLLALSIGGSAVTKEWSGYINKALGISNTKIVTKEGTQQDPIHFKSKFNTYQDVLKNARAVAKKAQAEGTVLMRNKNNALPLTKNDKVTLLSYNSVDVALGGTGSGGVVSSADRKFDLRKACEGKLSVNPIVYDFYQEKYDAKYGFIETRGWGGTSLNFRVINKVNELNISEFGAEQTGSFSTYGDAAIYVFSRIGGEGSDLTAEYLDLTPNEISILEAMKNGPFKKRIVLLNTFNTPNLGWLDDYNIDAALYIGGPGEVGLDAVTDILVGDITPSGHLADTYVKDVTSHPAMRNFGDFQYTNASDIVNKDSRKYLMYNEGIYVGYRYYETRYEDMVLGRGKANSDSWRYVDNVVYPFGHGLSYATFTQNLDRVNVDFANKKAEITVTVKNTSTVKGKDVVQVYAQTPYLVGGVEKSAIQLCGFTKTAELKAGEAKTYTVDVNLADIASYDYKTYRTFILDKGDYYFAIGNNAHDALNNVLAAKGKTTADGMDASGDAGKAFKANKGTFDKDEYRLSSQKTSITNQFQNADINTYVGGTEQEVTYLSRNDWQGTYPKNMKGFKATDAMVKEIASYYSSATNGSTKPTAYTPGSSDTSAIKTDAEKKYTLAMMIGAKFDDPNWDVLLDQLTIQDYLDSTSQGRKPLASVGLNATTAVDGPAAWTKSNYIEDYKVQYDAEKVKKTSELMVAYPTETIFAGTWNVELLEEIGDSFGEEGLWGGGVGWYGPGANTHRTPTGGRNFEYFSEDGFLAGKLCEKEVHGAVKMGTIPYLKHFFLNDQETNRIGVCTFSNEQAIREIYLRAFQYAFETTGEDDPSCKGVMGAFNRLGLVWSGHHSKLWKNVMEGEWGFRGNVTTDFGQKQGSLMEPLLAYEAGTHMFCTSGTGFAKYLEGVGIRNDAKLMANMREAIHRQLFNFANSAAMNGMTSDSYVVTVATWYDNLFVGLIVATSIVLACSAALLGWNILAERKEKSKE